MAGTTQVGPTVTSHMDTVERWARCEPEDNVADGIDAHNDTKVTTRCTMFRAGMTRMTHGHVICQETRRDGES